MTNREWIFLIGSFLFAACLVFSPLGLWGPFSWATAGLSYMAAFFHELGHALCGWVFGYPSLPAFDFTHGGGITLIPDRQWPIQIIMYGAGAYGLYQLKRSDHNFFFIPLGVLYIILCAISFSDWHEALILFMGHGAEIMMGAFFLTRALFNVLLIRPSERWLNAIVGSFFLFQVIHMSWQIIHDRDYADGYIAQKGGHGFGDLSRIADNFLFHWDLHGVAWFLIGTAVTVAILIPTCLYWVGIRKSA